MRIPRGRAVGAARCGWGAACLLAPGRVVSIAGGRPDTRSIDFARILGVREILQGGAALVDPSRRVVGAGVAVDLVHAASAAGVAALDTPRRAPALANALTATLWALLGVLALADAETANLTPDRRRDDV